MKIPSDEIPQANVLEDVIKTVVTISKGGRSFQEIAKAIGKGDRQGRYYRDAGELLGLIVTPTRNNSVLTPLGEQLVRTNPSITNPLVIQAVLNARIFQRLIPFMEFHKNEGVSEEDIVNFIVSVTDISTDSQPSTPQRRVSSVVRWLEALNLIVQNKGRYFLSNKAINSKVKLLEFTDPDEPILPRTNALNDYKTVEMRSKKAQETIISFRNLAATERADNAHRKLVNLVADRIKTAGSIPRYNLFIDLATRYGEINYIFEMKSITQSNARSQVRTGLSQLFEYRYIQNLSDAHLVLVIENSLPKKINWMVEYLEDDRNVSVIWNGDNQLHGTNKTKDKLSFLSIA